MKIIIPVGVVVLAGIVVLVLWLTGVFSSGGGSGDLSEPTATRSSDRDREDEDEDDEEEPVETGRPSPRPPIETPDEETPTPTPTESGAPSSNTPAGPAQAGMIPGGGGEVTDAAGDYKFTPDRTGLWTMLTRYSGDYDPMLTIYGPNGAVVAANDDGFTNYNAFLVTNLDSGSEYTVSVTYYGEAGTCSLIVTPGEMIPAGGGDIRVSGHTGFAFAPNQSGVWTLYTSNESNCDPFLVIFDQYGEELDWDDDSADGINAYLEINLTSGQTYTICCADYYGDPVSCTLTVTPGSAGGGGGGGGGGVVPSASGSIPSSGGTLSIDEATDVIFTPDKEGLWMVYTSDNGNDDPYVTIINQYSGNVQAENDNGWGDYNALIYAFLAPDFTYTIRVTFNNTESGSCVLNVKSPVELSPSGGTIQANGPTGVIFIPAQSGTYEMRTSNSGDYDPYVNVYDPYELIAQGDDEAGGLDVLIEVYLEAGVQYELLVGFWNEAGQRTGVGSCTFEVTRK